MVTLRMDLGHAKTALIRNATNPSTAVLRTTRDQRRRAARWRRRPSVPAEPMDEFTHVTRLNGTIPFEILRGTYTHQRFAPHLHETYAIGVVERGASRAHIGAHEHFYLPGDVIVIAPHVVHTGAPAAEEGWSYRMFYVPAELLASVVAEDEAPSQFRRAEYSDPAMADWMIAVHQLLEREGELLQKESAISALLGAMLLRYRDRALPRIACAPRAALARVREYLTAHFTETVRLAELSRIAGLSPFHLNREFRKAYGLPPYAYLELVRVNHAKAMLLRGARLSDVTFASGFSDQSHFTRRFKRVFGYPPGHYSRRCVAR